MPLTDEQVEAVKAALNRYLATCPICRSNTWTLGQEVQLLPRILLPSHIDTSAGQPCVSALCTTCGSVQLFNVFYLPGLADKLGIKPLAKPNA